MGQTKGESAPQSLAERTRAWLAAVFSGTAQCIWICAGAISVIAFYLPWISTNIPHFIRPLAWLVLTGGFSFANFAAYSKVSERALKAEGQLEGFVVTLDEADAREVLRPNDQSPDGKEYHFVEIKFALVVRNRSIADSTIELIGCDTEINDELELNDLSFDRSTDEHRSKYRDVPAGSTHRLRGTVMWQLPRLPALLTQPSVQGQLRLRDTREAEYMIGFMLQLKKVEQPQPQQIVRRRGNWATGL